MSNGEGSSHTETFHINPTYAADRWRFVCPRGHIEWRPRGETFYCLACSKRGSDPRSSYLIDRRGRERVYVDQFEFVEAGGPDGDDDRELDVRPTDRRA